MRKRKQDQDVEIEDTLEGIDPLGSELQDEVVEGEEAERQAEDVKNAELEDDGLGALLETPEAVVQRLTEELDEQKEKCLRLAAEFDNFRKRVERQRGENRHNAKSEVVRSILETLDNLARVTALDGTDASVADVIAGVQMVERGLLRELESAGLVKVGNVDDLFDPHVHDAVATALAEDREKYERIAAVLQVGYRFGNTLLRPARVQVYVPRLKGAGTDE